MINRDYCVKVFSICNQTNEQIIEGVLVVILHTNDLRTSKIFFRLQNIYDFKQNVHIHFCTRYISKYKKLRQLYYNSAFMTSDDLYDF